MGQEGPWWFSVKYGEDMTQLFNMDCWACTLVNHVRREPHAQACLAWCQQARDTTCAHRCLTATAGTAAAQIKDKCGYEKIPEPVDLDRLCGCGGPCARYHRTAYACDPSRPDLRGSTPRFFKNFT